MAPANSLKVITVGARESNKPFAERYTTTTDKRPVDFVVDEDSPYAQETSAAAAAATGLIALHLQEEPLIKDGNFRKAIIDWVQYGRAADANNLIELKLFEPEGTALPFPASLPENAATATPTDEPKLPPEITTTFSASVDASRLPMRTIKDATLYSEPGYWSEPIGSVPARVLLKPLNVAPNGWYLVVLHPNSTERMKDISNVPPGGGWISGDLVTAGSVTVSNLTPEPIHYPPTLTPAAEIVIRATVPQPATAAPSGTQQGWQMPVLDPGTTPRPSNTPVPPASATPIIGILSTNQVLYTAPNGLVIHEVGVGCRLLILGSVLVQDENGDFYIWYQVQEACGSNHQTGYMRGDNLIMAVDEPNAQALARHYLPPDTPVPTIEASSPPVEAPVTQEASPVPERTRPPSPDNTIKTDSSVPAPSPTTPGSGGGFGGTEEPTPDASSGSGG